MTDIKLREISLEDIPVINAWRNDKTIIDYLGNNFLYITEEIDQRWFEQYLKNRDQSIRLAILDSQNGTYIGNVNLTGIHKINRSAEFSIFIGDKNYWSKGFGKQATRAMLEHGFNDLNLNRIYLTVLENNERAISMYTSIGFTKEGVQRQAIYKNGNFHDLVMMSILSDEI